MTFQQISLDQSIYNKQKPKWGSNVQPTKAKSQGGFAAAGGNEPNSFVEQQKAEWAAEDKAKKAERDAQMAQLQNIGAQTVKQAQQATLAQAKQQQEVKQQVESNPEAAAKEMYELMKTLPDDAKQQLLQQIFTPTSTGGFMSAGNKKVNMPDKYNPIANVFLEKGWAMFDPKGNVNLSEPEPTYEKGTFEEDKGGNLINTATGETIIRSDDIPKGITPTQILDVIKEARAYTTGLVDPSMIEGLTPEGRSTFFERADKKFKEHVSWILQNTYSMTLEQATKIANGIPKEDTIGAPTGGGGTTDPTIVGDLKKLFDENPSEVANRKAYEDKYGAENVAAALIKTVKPTTESITKEFKNLNYPTSPAGGGSIKAF